MKPLEIKFCDLLFDNKNMEEFPYSYKSLIMIIHTTSKPAYYFKGRKMKSIQNENLLIKGNGLRLPISKFKVK